MVRKLIPVLLIIAVLTLSPYAGGDSSSAITFREMGNGMEASNQRITLTWAKSSMPELEISSGTTRISIGNYEGYELEEVAGNFNFTKPQVVSVTDSSSVPAWGYSTSRIVSEKGLQVEHVQSVPISGNPSRKVSFSVSNVISDGEIYFHGQRVLGSEDLQTITLSNWPWTNYDDILAVRVSIGSDIVPEGDIEPLSSNGPGIQKISPYITHATLVSNGQESGSVRWSHEAETLTAGATTVTLTQVYVESLGHGTDLIFIFSGAYGADRISYSYAIEAFPLSGGQYQYPNYTLPVVAGAVVVLVLASIMFRRRWV